MGIDHEAAIRTHTPERYILGELKPLEREEFEEHLADCRMCMQEIRAMDIFAANASAAYADEAAAKTEVKSSGWFGFLRPGAFPALAFSGALNLALLVCVGVGIARFESLREPRPGVTEVFAVHPPARSGENQVCPVGKNSAFATLRFDVSQPYQRYSYSLEGAGQSSLDAAKTPPSETLNLTVSVEGLKPGDHKFKVTGWDGLQEKPIGECILRVEPGK
jgi:hypothetical protein